MDTNPGEDNSGVVSEKDTPAKSLLNQFILGQLKERQYCDGEIASGNGFVLPKLQLGSTKLTNFLIPPLKLSKVNDIPLSKANVSPKIISQTLIVSRTFNDDIGEISSGLSDLHMHDSENLGTKEEIPTTAIDLTAALSSVTGIVRRKQRAITFTDDFQIPFIECDRQEKPILLPIVNNYFQLSAQAITRFKGKRLATPSSCGRIICLNYRRIQPLPKISHSFKVKHKIHRFHFDTKSPDDMVLATLNKYHRQY